MTEELPLLTPDPRRSERTTARCHDRLARQRKRLEVGRNPSRAYLAIERALVGALCVIYISGVALIAVQILGGR